MNEELLLMEKLRSEKTKTGISYSEIGKIANIDRVGTIKKLKSDNPTLATFCKLCDGLGLKIVLQKK